MNEELKEKNEKGGTNTTGLVIGIVLGVAAFALTYGLVYFFSTLA